MFEVIPLGVGAAIPTPDRHLSGTVVRRRGRSVLFDCGEGTQLQLVRAGLLRGRLDAVCITHLHGDHVLGLPGLVSTLGMMDRSDPLTVVGPVGLKTMMAAIPGLGRTDPPFEIRYVELAEGFEHAFVFEDAEVTVEARPLHHRVFCAGYRFQERTRPGTLDAEAARAAGIPDGPDMAALKRGEPVTLADGTVVAPDGLVGPEQPGAAFAYLLDTAPCDGGRQLAESADLVMHDATFTDAHADRAAETLHATARQAAEVARDAGAQRLLLTHFSARYDDLGPLVDEARAVFPDVEAARELERYAVRR